MAVVQVREKRPVRRAEVLAVAAQGIEIKVILKAHQVGPAIHGVDPGAGEGAVETVDRAGGQSLRAGNPSGTYDGSSTAGNRLHQRRSERMLVYLHPDVILDRVRQGETGDPDATVGS